MPSRTLIFSLYHVPLLGSGHILFVNNRNLSCKTDWQHEIVVSALVVANLWPQSANGWYIHASSVPNMASLGSSICDLADAPAISSAKLGSSGVLPSQSINTGFHSGLRNVRKSPKKTKKLYAHLTYARASMRAGARFSSATGTPARRIFYRFWNER